jgi:hypothetical protein
MEYILILAFTVTLFVTIFKGVLAPMLKNAEGRFEKSLQTMFSGDNLHSLHFKISK